MWVPSTGAGANRGSSVVGEEASESVLRNRFREMPNQKCCLVFFFFFSMGLHETLLLMQVRIELGLRRKSRHGRGKACIGRGIRTYHHAPSVFVEMRERRRRRRKVYGSPTAIFRRKRKETKEENPNLLRVLRNEDDGDGSKQESGSSLKGCPPKCDSPPWKPHDNLIQF